MSLPRVRFLHAAHLCLGQQLRDVGPVPGDLRQVLQQASLAAWTRLVEAALREAVDFVLLTGNTLSASQQSLEAFVALRTGLERLAECDIPVIAIPGPSDPASFWQTLPTLPDNFTLLGEEPGEEITLSRDEGPFATLHHLPFDQRFDPAHHPEQLQSLWAWAPDVSSEEELQHHLVLVDHSAESGSQPAVTDAPRHQSHISSSMHPGISYWSIPGGTMPHTWPVATGFALTPGSSQALHPTELGPRGAWLIELTETGACESRFVSLCAARYETIHVPLQGQETLDEWVAVVREKLGQLPASSGDEVWLLDCQLQLNPERTWQREDLRARHDWFRAAIQTLSQPGRRLWLRHLDWPEISIATSDDFLIAEYQQQVARLDLSQTLPQRLAGILGSQTGEPLSPRLQAVLSEIPAEQVLRRVRQLGRDWVGDAA